MDICDIQIYGIEGQTSIWFVTKQKGQTSMKIMRIMLTDVELKYKQLESSACFVCLAWYQSHETLYKCTGYSNQSTIIKINHF